MASTVSAYSVSTLNFWSVLATPTTSLSAIKDANGDINQIRMLLKGNKQTCLELFKQAVKEQDVIAQIQLSQAFYGIKWGKDESKDFSHLTAQDLEKFSYYPREFILFRGTYDQAMEVTYNWESSEAISFDTFHRAAAYGYLPAVLELIDKQWKHHTCSYGFAVQLRPYVGRGDKRLDHYFGLALKNGCAVGSEPYYEGLYWMNRSEGITVKCPKQDQSFEDFKTSYVTDIAYYHTHYDCDGFVHVGPSDVLAPSKEAWDTFVKKKLGNVEIAPLEYYLFNYDREQIKRLLNEYTTKVLPDSINSLEIYHPCKEIDEGKKLGTIFVQQDTFAIDLTFKDSKIQPLIDFIENVMKRSGCARSADSWLTQIHQSSL